MGVQKLSFSDLRDIFIGRIGTDHCVKSVLFLKSPNNVKEYLLGVHRIAFPDGDTSRDERWKAYANVKGTPYVIPIRETDLLNQEFMNKQANKLSFDISRFAEFLAGYAKVGEDIKPIVLHYAMIYLFDFFSRTWLKYERNWSHGIKLRLGNEYAAKIEKSGVFPRAIDAFYFLGQSSLLSPDEDDGIGYQMNVEGKSISEMIGKMKYSECPELKLAHLINVYEKLGKIVGSVSESNQILVGYVILFILSSISRYRAEDWFKIRENIDLKNKFDLLQYDFLYKWTPSILLQTILRKGIKEKLSIPE